jgi:phosphoribosylformylglycinamidine cyclo-ligase
MGDDLGSLMDKRRGRPYLTANGATPVAASNLPGWSVMTQAPPSRGSGGDAYRDAGVDVAAGNAFVEAIGPAAARTRRPGVLAGLGGFGGLFDLSAAGRRDPVLVAATDGVGTKLLLAQSTGAYRGLGVDLVAMSVNDIVVQGAEPLFFLDYYATGRLEANIARNVVDGVADGCVEAGCALLGGETAEMPGVYPPGAFDLAGFAVGCVERERILPRTDAVRAGDALVAVASSGLHSNGFSLVRRIVATAGADLASPAPFDAEVSLGAALMRPTRIYTRAATTLIDAGAHALAHITGGGLVENVPRVLPRGLRAVIDLDSWALPPLFGWLAEAGGLDRTTLARTFNLGIGLVGIVPAAQAQDAVAALEGAGERAWLAGRVAEAADGPLVTLEGGPRWPRP